MAQKQTKGKSKPSQQPQKGKITLVSLLTLILTCAYLIVFTDVKFPFDISFMNAFDEQVEQTFQHTNDDQSSLTTNDNSSTSSQNILSGDKQMSVHVIDVGQGSSTLFVSDGRTILIDAGENGSGKVIKEYLDNLNIDSIDLFIGTHPHSDHIGGMDELMKTVDLQTIIMPELPTSIIPTTKTYLDVLNMIDSQKKQVDIAKVGQEYVVGNMTLEILGPVEAFEDLNEISVISKITFGSNSVLVTGDAEHGAEKALVEKFPSKLASTIYIVGHHGSSTSSSNDFVDLVNPAYGAISLGKDNSYGHPHRETVDVLNRKNVQYYRTDERGNIVFYVDENEIRVECEK